MNHLIDDYDLFGVTSEYCCGCSYCGNSTLILENLIFIAFFRNAVESHSRVNHGKW
jgi:hypothetical protein